MSLNDNIKNAVVVLQNTYKNVNKMLGQCRTISVDYGYISVSDKVLRYKSDTDSNGWLVNSLILVFQKVDDPACPGKKEWKDGPVYAAQVFLGSAEEPDLPAQVYVSRFDYDNISGWDDERFSTTDHWRFYDPIHKIYPGFSFTEQEGCLISEPNHEKYGRQYGGLKKTVSKIIPLSEVKAENIGELIFGTFDKLK